MRTIRLIVEYDGGRFSGWQRQNDPKRPTIQEALEAAIAAMTQTEVRVRGASRTDAGVHARGQVAAFDIEREDIPLIGFQRGLDTLLPDAIAIRRAEEAELGWDPRRTSRGKRYRYTFWNDAQPSALERHRAWFVREPLDVERMNEAASTLVGTHDFEAFRSAGCSARHAVRTMYKIEAKQGEYYKIDLFVLGNAFVRNMVRIIAGNLKEVGAGRRSVDDVRSLLSSKDRTKGGITAPPHGLCLEEVIYDARLPERPKDNVDLEG